MSRQALMVPILTHRAGQNRGFSLIEMIVALGVMGVMASAMIVLFENQNKSNNFLQYQIKRTQLQGAIINQFLSKSENCGCLFKNAQPHEFLVNPSGSELVVDNPPTEIGAYQFAVPGDCDTATVPLPLINSTGVDGVLAKSIKLSKINSVAGGYIGQFVVELTTHQSLAGPRDLQIKIPVIIATTPGAPGQVAFSNCSALAAPVLPNFQSGEVLINGASSHVICQTIDLNPGFTDNNYRVVLTPLSQDYGSNYAVITVGYKNKTPTSFEACFDHNGKNLTNSFMVDWIAIKSN